MTIALTLRSQKNARLTNAEVDANFVALRAAILATTAGITISSVGQDGDKVRLVYSDGSRSPTITLPTVGFRVRGAWRTGEMYKVGDFVLHDRNAYSCVSPHVATSFELALGSGQFVLFLEGGQDGDDGSTGVSEAPANGRPHVRQDGQWVELDLAAGEGPSSGASSATWLVMPPKLADSGDVVAVYLAATDLTYAYSLASYGLTSENLETAAHSFHVWREFDLIQTIDVVDGIAQSPQPPQNAQIPAGSVLRITVTSANGNPVSPRPTLLKVVLFKA